MAFIFESMRYSPMVAYRSIIHTVTEPITANGYSFNRDDMLWTAISSIQFDEKNFPEPFKFNPLRHIDPVTGEFHQPAKGGHALVSFSQILNCFISLSICSSKCTMYLYNSPTLMSIF